MSHLNGEALARLADEAPTPLEAAHLAECSACCSELDAIRGDVRALGALGAIEPPEHAWPALEERLLTEGLVRRTRRRSAAWARLAAALALFLTGTLAGFAWRSATLPAAPAVAAASEDTGAPERALPPTPERAAPETDTPPDAAPARAAGVAAPQLVAAAPAARADDPEPAAAAPGRQEEMPAREPRITGPADPDARPASPTPRTAQEAAILLREAEGMYLDALARYAQLAGNAGEPGDPLARLAALEGIVLTTREALGRAPADPIINGYHMTALAQREATLQQIAATTRNPWF